MFNDKTIKKNNWTVLHFIKRQKNKQKNKIMFKSCFCALCFWFHWLRDPLLFPSAALPSEARTVQPSSFCFRLFLGPLWSYNVESAHSQVDRLVWASCWALKSGESFEFDSSRLNERLGALSLSSTGDFKVSFCFIMDNTGQASSNELLNLISNLSCIRLEPSRSRTTPSKTMDSDEMTEWTPMGALQPPSNLAKKVRSAIHLSKVSWSLSSLSIFMSSMSFLRHSMPCFLKIKIKNYLKDRIQSYSVNMAWF